MSSDASRPDEVIRSPILPNGCVEDKEHVHRPRIGMETGIINLAFVILVNTAPSDFYRTPRFKIVSWVRLLGMGELLSCGVKNFRSSS